MNNKELSQSLNRCFCFSNYRFLEIFLIEGHPKGCLFYATIFSMQKITIFTDGASRGNPGPGGWGAIVITEEKVAELGGGEKNTTNNRMELSGALGALSYLDVEKISGEIILYTDSSYLINGITKWVYGWSRNGWKTKTKDDVVNRDLWEKLYAVSQGKKIEWKYLGGHVGIVGNERADDIATGFADGTLSKKDLYAGGVSGYGKDILNIKHDETAAKEKSSGRTHSKAKAYSYLSLLDGKVEKHATWAECEARVKGKPAKFKKAISAEDEKRILAEWGVK